MTVFMFDRDRTVDVNPPRDKDAVPLSWVKHLAHETNNKVFATGNQHLRKEALIPGMEEAKMIWEDMRGYPVEYDDAGYADGFKPSRRNGLRMVKEIHPDENEFIVVDDIDLRDMAEEGIIHYYPWDFYKEVQNGQFRCLQNEINQNNQPENARDRDVDKWLKNSGFYEEYGVEI